MTQATISKSQYVKGLQCPKALWFYRHRKDLRPPIDASLQARFDSGNEVGEYAKHYFGEGVEVDAVYWDTDAALAQTEHFVEDGQALIYEATAVHPADGSYARMDILKRIAGSDQWDLIEVKSSTQVKDYHYDDMAFQYYVFAGAGYDIRNCYMMLVDREYVKEGGIEPQGLLKLEDISEQVRLKQDRIAKDAMRLIEVTKLQSEPDVTIGNRCGTPFECDYCHHCWKDIPDYSVYDVFPNHQREEIVARYGAELKTLPGDVRPPKSKYREDLECYLSGESRADPVRIKQFLGQLQYPLYFLDYETLMPAVPMFDGMRPYQHIPFQFSLHIQDAPDANVQHYGHLHKDHGDPRPDFAARLLKLCGDGGSVIVYNQAFEKLRNKEMGIAFPQYTEGLEAINRRVIDLLIPFRNRYLYHPNQKSSASLKAVLPCFTDMSYSDLEISGGEDAMAQYARFARGKVPEEDLPHLWEILEEYCKLDTLAMVSLLGVLYKEGLA